MIATQQARPRIGLLAVILVLVMFVALGIPGRMLTQWAHAVERGKLQASSEELAVVNQNLARVQEVSHAFRLVAKVARPGVVHIRVAGDEQAHKEIVELEQEQDRLRGQLEKIAAQLEDDESKDPSREAALEFYERYNRLRSIESQIEKAAQRLQPASGSGIIFDRDGHILTNNHVVEQRGEIRVTLPDEREYDATLVGTDPNTDLAVIKIGAADLHPLKLGDSDQMQVGDWVIAVGAPFGLSQSVTHGIISATGRNDVLTGRGIIYQDFLQTDAAINPGNSGGPLLNLHGEVIGVNTAIATNGDTYNAGIAFTIPSNMAVKIANQLKERGQVARGWLGITMGEMTAVDREIFGIKERQGVRVRAVIEGAPAEQAGLLVDDVILTVDARPIETMAELRAVIADVFPGESATFGLLRDARRVDVSVKLERRPSNEDFAVTPARALTARKIEPLGLYVRTLLPVVAERLGYTERDRGAFVVDTVDDEENKSPVKPGELIVSCNGHDVANVGELAVAIDTAPPDRQLRLTVLDKEDTRRVVRVKRP